MRGLGKKQAGTVSAAGCSLLCFLGKISDCLPGEEDGELLLLCPPRTKTKSPHLPRSRAALKTPFTSLLCDIPKHNNGYLESESSFKIKTTQRENRKSGGRGQSPSPAGPWSEASETAHTASCSTAHQSVAFTRQTWRHLPSLASDDGWQQEGRRTCLLKSWTNWGVGPQLLLALPETCQTLHW